MRSEARFTADDILQMVAAKKHVKIVKKRMSSPLQPFKRPSASNEWDSNDNFPFCRTQRQNFSILKEVLY